MQKNCLFPVISDKEFIWYRKLVKKVSSGNKQGIKQYEQNENEV